MITTEHARIMARYNRWQNRSLVAAADGLDEAERWRDRGAFFGSIAATLNHIYWDDRLWLARLTGRDGVDAIARRHPYTDEPRDWGVYVRDRAALDEEIIVWADGIAPDNLGRTVRWMRGEEELTPSYALCVVHLFNHQTHHRGQVHALLTAAGVMPDETDLQVLPYLR